MNACTALSFERIGADIRVSIEGHGLAASTNIPLDAGDGLDAQTGTQGLGIKTFFRRLARGWMDVPEQIAYASPDNSLAMTCEWDQSGHFHLRVRLCRADEWLATSTIDLELGLLDRIANEIEAAL